MDDTNLLVCFCVLLCPIKIVLCERAVFCRKVPDFSLMITGAVSGWVRKSAVDTWEGVAREANKLEDNCSYVFMWC